MLLSTEVNEQQTLVYIFIITAFEGAFVGTEVRACMQIVSSNGNQDGTELRFGSSLVTLMLETQILSRTCNKRSLNTGRSDNCQQSSISEIADQKKLITRREGNLYFLRITVDHRSGT